MKIQKLITLLIIGMIVTSCASYRNSTEEVETVDTYREPNLRN